MTKGELVDHVWLKVNAGRPLGDVPIHRAVIASLIPAVINYVVVGEYRLRRDERRADISSTDRHGYVDPEFLGTYEVDIQKDIKRGRKYAKLPYRVQSIPHGLGLNEVLPCNGQLVQFHRVNSEIELMALDESVLGMITAFWMEQNPEQRIYFHGLSPVIEKVLVRMVVSVNDLDDDDQIPVPGNIEFQVIDILVQHFMGQRQLPVDAIANANEDNNVR